MFDQNKWFVDESGGVRFLREFGPDNIELIDHGSWVEVYTLGAPDGGGPGREVTGEYQLHEGDPETVMSAWGVSK